MLLKTRYSFVLLTVALVAGTGHAQIAAHGRPMGHADRTQGHGGAGQGHGPGFQTRSAGPEEIEVPAQGLTLPMQDFGGRPVVEVKINGAGPYRFILDTGATINLIDASLNNELELPAAAVHAATPSGRPAPQLVSIRELTLGQAAIRGSLGAVVDLRNMLGPDSPRGVLSAANFPGYLLTLDYPARRISLQKGKLEKAEAESIFEYSSGDPLPTVPVTIAGRKMRVHMDTGSPSGLILPTKFIKELPLASEPQEIGRARGHSGDFPISKAKVDGGIEMGGHKLALDEVLFSDVAPGRSTAATGLIGYQVLRNFVVTFDPRNRRIRFVQPPPA